MTVPLNTPVTRQTMIVILGPTASGKTALAVQVAARLGGEIISADSRQVYRGMDIGTGKDLAEYRVGAQTVPHHLIDVLAAGEKYNVSRFQHDFKQAFQSITERGKPAVLCGGTGLYIESVLQDFSYTGVPVDLEYRAKLEVLTNDELYEQWSRARSAFRSLADTSTRKRLIRALEIERFLSDHPDYQLPESNAVVDYCCYGLNPEVDLRRARISKRLKDRLSQGMVEEVQALLETGVPAETMIYYGLEYKYITQYLTGEMSKPEMVTKLETEIHRFAKRQMTFFRKMERDGINITWLDSLDREHQVQQIMNDFYKD